MSNINWSLLGANIRDRYMDAQPAYKLGDGFEKGMKDIAGTMDMYNREQAIGKMLSQRIDAQKSKIQKLESKLMKLKDELGKSFIPKQDEYLEPSGTSEDIGDVPDYGAIFGTEAIV